MQRAIVGRARLERGRRGPMGRRKTPVLPDGPWGVSKDVRPPTGYRPRLQQADAFGSGWPGHLAAGLRERARDLGAVDDGSDLEQIVRRRALRLRVTDKERSQELVLVRAVEGRVRTERDLRRQV